LTHVTVVESKDVQHRKADKRVRDDRRCQQARGLGVGGENEVLLKTFWCITDIWPTYKSGQKGGTGDLHAGWTGETADLSGLTARRTVKKGCHKREGSKEETRGHNQGGGPDSIKSRFGQTSQATGGGKGDRSGKKKGER